MASINSIRGISEKIIAWHRELLELQTDRIGSCWVWNRSLNWDGYGHTSLGGRSTTVHRVSYLIYNGDIPQGMVVRHCCPGGENRACVNPAHLILGTRGDNNRDTALRGRGGKGGPRKDARVPRTIEAAQLASDALIHSFARSGALAREIAERIGLPENHVTFVTGAQRNATGHRRASRLEMRFWSKVEKTGSCWLWRAMTVAGYGRLRIGRTLVGAHQISWRLHRGPIPKGLVVCHNCPSGDNPACVNPDHLFLALQADNLRDAARKKKRRQGGGQDKEPHRIYGPIIE